MVSPAASLQDKSKDSSVSVAEKESIAEEEEAEVETPPVVMTEIEREPPAEKEQSTDKLQTEEEMPIEKESLFEEEAPTEKELPIGEEPIIEKELPIGEEPPTEKELSIEEEVLIEKKKSIEKALPTQREPEEEPPTQKELTPTPEPDRESEPVPVIDIEDDSEEVKTPPPTRRRSARQILKNNKSAVLSKKHGRSRKTTASKSKEKAKETEPKPATKSTAEPTAKPVSDPTTESAAEPMSELTTEPTTEPTAEPTAEPADEPADEPRNSATIIPRISFKPLSTAELDRPKVVALLKLYNRRTRSSRRRSALTKDSSDKEDQINQDSDHDEFQPHDEPAKPRRKTQKRKAKASRPITEDATEKGDVAKKPRTRESKKSTKEQEVEYWSDGKVKKKPTLRVLQSIGTMNMKRYNGRATLESPLILTIPESKSRDEDGKILIVPEDMPKYGRGYQPMVIENSEDLVIDTEKFTMFDICGELAIGQQDEKFSKYEEERMKRRKKKLEIYKLKKIARAEGRSIEYISRIGNGDHDDQIKEMEEGQRQFESQYNAMPKVTISAPQMQIVGGEIQVNTESTFVDRHQQAQLELGDSREIEEETSFSKIVNNASYSKHKIAERWDKKETEKFYSALSMWGTDFTMLAQLFPGRTRRELRNKFKLEERKNRVKVDLAIERRLPTNVEDYSMATGKPLVTTKEVQDLISEIDDDYRNRIMVETANREKARAADAENAMYEDATTFGGISTQGYGRGGQRKTKAQIRKELARNEIVLGSIDD
ncbi:hypothetical protein D0Z03_002808 [Geotrichum reessii]|nr:hypothetical protein D0Z03_002808 [Galactomyces reessii]